MGLNQNAINSIYQKYGNTVQGRAICQMLGTTPEALKADADMIVTGQRRTLSDAGGQTKRFPRLR
jgi:hypothetical protein